MATLSVQLYSDVTSVNSVFVSDWIITVIILVLMCSLVSVFTLVTLHLLHFDVVYNWSISLLPPIVLDNLYIWVLLTNVRFSFITEIFES